MSAPSIKVTRGELRLMALAAVNDDLSQAIADLQKGRIARLSDVSYYDRIRLKEATIENELNEKGIVVT
jgi:hypothetical protein